MPDDAILEEVIIPSLAVPKVLGCLKVTENPKAKDNDLHYATVCDSKAGDNIPYFGNCKRLPDSEWEMAKFTEGCTKTQGTCQYLMRLEKEWENFDIGKEYLQFTDDVHGAKSGITMTSVLFCKHGGFIYPVTSGQVISQEQNFEMVFQYIDKDGNLVEAIWNISDAEFIDCNALTLEEIEKICNSHNPELVTRGFAEGIYNYCISFQLNPKVMLATLGQEQGWCKNGNYEKAFGVGAGGNPRNFSDSNEGIAGSCNVFIKKYNEGLSSSLVLSGINKDSGPNYPETKAVWGEDMAQWQNEHSKYVEYMENGQDITCVNAAMYAKLCYTPWVDFPPQNSHPLEDWLKIYNSLEDCLKDD